MLKVKALCKSITFLSVPSGRLLRVTMARAFAGTAVLAGSLGCAAYTSAAEAATETVLYSFGSAKNDGANPQSPSLINIKGVLYGTTEFGGTQEAGTVFSLNPLTGAEVVLHSFESGADGQWPYGGLIKVKGTLYGTTFVGGASGAGIVFSIKAKSGAEKVLYSFGNEPDGQDPPAGLINVGGTLYGVTAYGGTYGDGALFSFNPQTSVETVLYSFGSGTDGIKPQGDLINVSGTLYGMTYRGGIYGYGTLFSFTPQTNVETALHSFGNGTDGWSPIDNSGLINVKGTLFGTTVQGGTNGEGTVFSFDPTTGVEKVVYAFAGNGTDGAIPVSGLTRFNGMLYGTTAQGGTNDEGTFFSLDPKNAVETVLHSFGGGTDGATPQGGLLKLNDMLYGTTTYGGTNSAGTVFSIVP